MVGEPLERSLVVEALEQSLVAEPLEQSWQGALLQQTLGETLPAGNLKLVEALLQADQLVELSWGRSPQEVE